MIDSQGVLRKMRKLLSLCSALVLLVCMVPAVAELEVTWVEGEAFFPEREDWTYRYQYRYPYIAGTEHGAPDINEYYDMAFSEMTNLIVPMFAQEETMIGQGKNEIQQEYRITCNNARFFSTCMEQRQTVGGSLVTSVSSQVFAVSGEYMGDTLTLRGLLMTGDSSEQLAGLILADIWRQVAEQAVDDPAWLPGLTMDALYADFDPEAHFYADELGNAVFYLQPGLYRTDDRMITFTYSAADVNKLIDQFNQREEGQV